MIRLIPVALTACLIGSSASAATYNFSYTFNGASLTTDFGSDVANGTTLNAGDSFSLNFSAAGDDYFEVTSALVGAFVPLSFAVDEAGIRVANIQTSWLLDGTAVATRDESNVTQQPTHIGAQQWDLDTGLKFDKVVIGWDLVSATEVASTATITTTINQSVTDFILQNSHTFYAGGPDTGAIEYRRAGEQENSAVVPLPAGMALYLPLILAGGAFAARRRRKA
jgi:hypothetical protein